jgi:putative ABC transport system ATP-binding protein
MTDRKGTADSLAGADGGSTGQGDADAGRTDGVTSDDESTAGVGTTAGGSDATDATNAEGSGDPAVELSDVRKTYHLGEPVHALDGVSLTIPSGSYTAVMGPSGSGKSTLMNLVGCLDTPSEGRVEVGGEDVSGLSENGKATLRGEKVGFVFQTFNLMPRLTAAENVALPMVFRDRSREERSDRAGDLLAQVGLGDRLDHQPSELSGGQRQRVAIARALANDPEIILADEPTGNLDTDTGSEILELFQRLHDADNTVLMVTHERHVAEHAARIVHLLDGEIDEIETVESPRRVAGRDAESGDGNEGESQDEGERGEEGEAVAVDGGTGDRGANNDPNEADGRAR